MEHPNKLIESFNGVIDFGSKVGRDPITPKNVLLRGCVLRNTDWIVGLVVNTGHDTKIMMSANATRMKASRLESKSSEQIIRIIILLAIVCFSGSTGQAIWDSVHDVRNIWYLNWKPREVGFWFVDFFYFFLLHATFVPVSLYVSMSMARYFQSYFMNNDLAMYYETADQPAIVRTMTLNEELGQISHIFSDKTGTLTCNIMDFRKMSVNGVTYGQGITEIGKAAWKLQNKPISSEILEGEEKAQANAQPHVSFYCPTYEKDMKDLGSVQRDKLKFFFRALSLCHDVIPERINGKIKLSASNPDDNALVCAASYFGYEFVDRKDQFCVIKDKDAGDALEEIELLVTIPFTSKRKRMSVVVVDAGVLRIICKGADTALYPRLKSGQEQIIAKTDEHVRDFSTDGLRCLFIAAADLKDKEFAVWLAAYQSATTDLNEIEKREKGLPNRIEELEDSLEQGLFLIGATAIEDKLQRGVPECISELVKAGLNIWVLTGDKEETAINIAVACNLILPKEYMEQIIINRSVAADEATLKAFFIHEIQVKQKQYKIYKNKRNSVVLTGFFNVFVCVFLKIAL